MILIADTAYHLVGILSPLLSTLIHLYERNKKYSTSTSDVCIKGKTKTGADGNTLYTAVC